MLGLEGQERFVLGLARLRAARKWGPRAAHGNVGQGIHVGEAARKALVLPVLAEAVFLVVRAHVEDALVSRVGGAPSIRPKHVLERGRSHVSVGGDFLTARVHASCARQYSTLRVSFELYRQILYELPLDSSIG